MKAQIVQHFDMVCHIWIELNLSNYAIDKVISQLSTDLVISDKLNLAKSKNLVKNLTKSDFG